VELTRRCHQVKLNEQGKWNVETKGYGIATLNSTKVAENILFAIGSNLKVRKTPNPIGPP
jgi:hypothetical protein